MSCCKTYDPCLDGKLNQIGSYASVARQSAESSATSATQAAASAAEAASIAELGIFFLGPHDVPPTTDNEGGPLQEGMIYYNTVSNGLFVWNGTVWASSDFNEFTNFTATGTTTARNLVTRMADVVNVKDFGAVGDGVADDTAAFQSAIDYVNANGGGEIICGDVYKISSINIKNNVQLLGELENPEAGISSTPFSLSGRKSRIILTNGSSITVGNSSGVRNLIINKEGLVAGQDATTWTDTAILVKGAGAILSNLCILGFNRAILANSSLNGERCARSRFYRVFFDCNSGISISYAYDIVYLSECHGNAITQTISPFRSGTAFEFVNDVDWGKMERCFCWGYQKGFVINNADNVILLNCGADYDPTASSNTSIGFSIIGTSQDAKLIGCLAAAVNKAVVIDNVTAVYANSTITSCSFWDINQQTINVISGNCLINSTSFLGKSTSTAIRIESTSGKVSISRNYFTQIIPYSFDAGIVNKIQIDSNILDAGSVDSTYGLQTIFDNQQDRVTYRSFNSSASGSRIVFDKSRGSESSPSVPINSDANLNLIGRAWDGSAWGGSAQIRAQTSGTVTSGSTPARMIFSTTPSGSNASIDRINIASDGTFSPLADDAYTCGGNGLRWSQIWAANGTIQTSDERAKTEIETSALGLEFINSLRPVSYKWIEGGKKVIRQVYRDAEGNECSPTDDGAYPAEIITESITGNRTHWGLLAQEVKAALPEGVDFGGWVLTDKDDLDSQQALRYDQFIAPLIKAVQELSERVKELESK